MEEPGQDFVRRFLLPFYGWAPELQKAVMKNLVEAYTWPIGILTRWLRTIAAGAPGVFSRVGLGTLIDPRQDEGFLNDLARERKTAVVEHVGIDGREYRPPLLPRLPLRGVPPQVLPRLAFTACLSPSAYTSTTK